MGRLVGVWMRTTGRAALLALVAVVASSCLIHERQDGFTREYTVIGQ